MKATFISYMDVSENFLVQTYQMDLVNVSENAIKANKIFICKYHFAPEMAL